VDTVAPLAARRGLEIERAAALAKTAGADAAWEVLRSGAPDDVVICTHGEVLRALIPRLQAEGVDIVGTAGGLERALTKGSAWCLEFDGERPARARFIPLAGTPS
jgi:broad specificity phosphatase PhoE